MVNCAGRAIGHRALKSSMVLGQVGGKDNKRQGVVRVMRRLHRVHRRKMKGSETCKKCPEQSSGAWQGRQVTMRVAMRLHRIIGGMGQLAYKTNMRMD